MRIYQAPLRDMQFLLHEVFRVEQFWQQSKVLAERIDADLAAAMLDQAATMVSETVSPLNRSGDEQGVRLTAGQVSTPDGFAAAFRLFAEGGFTALGGNPDFGGLGMPKVLGMLVDEMVYSANSAFGLYPALTAGACLTLDAHADEALKQRFLPPMYAGRWTGTMCLTEPQAGSDLGLIRTRAEPIADGRYQITGNKIFITGGDHDLADNIIHLVLARLPDAPSGAKGASLFLVPKYKVDAAGNPGDANAVTCGSLEQKMGIHGSATCVMHFDASEGYLVGEPHQGLKCMFTMMNYERLGIGLQGMGCGVMSYQNALAYAQERLQGRSPEQQSTGTVSILMHPDVRRMLLTMKALLEGCRALAVYAGMALDEARYGASSEAQSKGNAMAGLLTPVVKAFLTDAGLECTLLGQQVFGGHGYIREWGQEQLVRDARIAPIYEGTNGIQALDLLQRKVYQDRMRTLSLLVSELLADVERWASRTATHNMLEGHRVRLLRALEEVIPHTQVICAAADEQPALLNALATPYLHWLAYHLLGYFWLRMMVASVAQHDEPFYAAKLQVGDYFFRQVFPRVTALRAQLDVAPGDWVQMPDVYFG